MRKLLVCAAAFSGFAVQACAADLGDGTTLKDPLPDTLTWRGVTVYGTLDFGFAYQTHGLPESGAAYVGLDYALTKLSNQSISALTNNALEQSKIGVKIEEPIGMGLTVVGKIETDFNPLSGELSDACASLARASGFGMVTATNPTGKNGNVAANADGSRCGQAFSGQAYGGLSSPLYGTLTVGRQTSLIADGTGAYDPQHGSYAFSLIGFSGNAAAGIGATETARWDNSVKYIYQYGPAHAAVMYSSGGQDTPILGDAYGANIGATYRGFSIDAFYEKENGAVTLKASPTPLLTPTTLPGQITNNEAFSAMAKYTYDFGGGSKDGPSSRLTAFAGYVYMDISNPNQVQSFYNGDTTGGGYTIQTADAFNPFHTNKVLQTEWAGLSYETGPWTITGAYYHETQNSFLENTSATAFVNCAMGKKGASDVTQPAKITTPANCAGDINFASLVVDYAFNKHFDAYAGVSFADVSGGLGSGFLQNETVSVVTGLRLKF